MNRPVPMSQVCAEGLHVRCQGHGADGPCRCTDPAHSPKQAAADMRTASRAVRANPEKAGVARQHADILADQLLVAAEDLGGAIQHAKTYGGDAFELVDEPESVRRALQFARSVNATTGGVP